MPKLTREARDLITELQTWRGGYTPCVGSDLIPELDALTAKGKVIKIDRTYHYRDIDFEKRVETFFATKGDPAPLDERDFAILETRVAAMDKQKGALRVGDWVFYDDGTVRRIAHIHRDDKLFEDAIQTSDNGRYFLADTGCDMSGSLYTAVSSHDLKLTPYTGKGWVWFFHHDHYQKDNGVYASIPFQIFRCSEEPTRS